MEDWDDFLLLANRIIDDDLFVVISARPNSVSYSPEVAEMPSFLQRYFSQTNIIVIYPEQFGEDPAAMSFVDPMSSDISSAPSPIWSRVRVVLRKVNEWKRHFIGSHRPPRIQ